MSAVLILLGFAPYGLFLLFVWGCGLTASNADSINDPRSNDSNRLGVGAHRGGV